jgi:hypothetical protein
MTEGLKIVTTAVLGVAVFVLGQIVQKWFIDPIQEQRKLAGTIVYSLVFYANLFKYGHFFSVAAETRRTTREVSGRQAQFLDESYEGFKERLSEGSAQLRSLSSQIHQSLKVVPWYWLLERLRIVYRSEDLYNVANELVKLSNTSDRDTAILCQNNIIHLLKVRHLIDRADAQEL